MSTTGKWDELFSGRKWRIREEVSGSHLQPGPDGEVVTTFRRGFFEISGGAFQSLLSTNMGRRGWLLIETNADGSADLEPRCQVPVGMHALEQARRKYEGAIW